MNRVRQAGAPADQARPRPNGDDPPSNSTRYRACRATPGTRGTAEPDGLLERLLKFDGKPLFPERIAYTVPYQLSDEEAHLYMAVTDYVREEFNRAEALANARRAGTVGFALTILQRRLAARLGRRRTQGMAEVIVERPRAVGVEIDDPEWWTVEAADDVGDGSDAEPWPPPACRYRRRRRRGSQSVRTTPAGSAVRFWGCWRYGEAGACGRTRPID